MSKLQTLLIDPDTITFNHFRIETDKALVAISDDKKAILSEPLGNNEILFLLKEMIPEEVSNEFYWGNAVQYTFESENRNFNFEIRLNENEIIEIDILAEDKAKKTSKPPIEENKISVEEINPEIIDALMEADALIYNPNQKDSSSIQRLCDSLELNVKSTENPQAIIQTISYKQFDLFVMILDQNFKEDLVYLNILSMLMDSRREQFTILVAPGLKSGNEDLAYSLGVQMVLDISVSEKTEQYFKKSHDAWRRMLNPYKDVLVQHGRV